MASGLSRDGFKRKTYNEIVEDAQTRARELFGENVNLSDRSPLGLFIKIIAWGMSILWQLAEKVYFSAFVDDADGVGLDKVAKNIGMRRKEAEKAKGKITVTGTEGTVIDPSNLIIGTEGGIVFKPVETSIIDGTGEAEIEIEAVESGVEGNVPANTITKIITPIPGLDDVTNDDPTYGGRNAETDTEFRERYYQSGGAIAGAATTDGVRATLLEVPGVRAAITIQNTSMETDNEGRPPKSIHCYVLGGKPDDIANAILSSKAGGIETYGSETEIVRDLSGQEQIIKFSFAEVVPVYIRMTIRRSTKYPLDGDSRIRTALVRYIGGEDADGVIYSGLAMKENVVYYQLTKVAGIDGVDDLDLEVSTDGTNWDKSSIEIASNQKAETSHENVVINYA